MRRSHCAHRGEQSRSTGETPYLASASRGRALGGPHLLSDMIEGPCYLKLKAVGEPGGHTAVLTAPRAGWLLHWPLQGKRS